MKRLREGLDVFRIVSTIKVRLRVRLNVHAYIRDRATSRLFRFNMRAACRIRLPQHPEFKRSAFTAIFQSRRVK